MITINHEACIGCGRCAWDCFPGALTLEEGKACLSAPGNCIGCGHCIAICPKAAIRDNDPALGESYPLSPAAKPEGLLNLIRGRRSCRHYLGRPVSEETLHMLLEAARACPTAKNLQSTRYIAVTERIPRLLDAALEVLGEVGLRQRETATEPDELRRADNFILWRETRRSDRSFDPLFFHSPLLLLFVSKPDTAWDAAGAAAYTELMAASLGMGCLYSGYFAACAAGSREIRDMLCLEETEQIVRCLVLGWPDVKFLRTPPRKLPNLTRL